MADCQLTTLAGCELVIGRYPRFLYNARGGGAQGIAHPEASEDVELEFASGNTTIPSLNWRTTRFLGLPLPPGISVTIQPVALNGHLNRISGTMQLAFQARFRFQAGIGPALSYSAPDLLVTTVLTTESINSQRHQRQGCRLQGSEPGLLVGAALIEPTGEAWLDRFLGLPDEALAVLRCQLTFLDSSHG